MIFLCALFQNSRPQKKKLNSDMRARSTCHCVAPHHVDSWHTLPGNANVHGTTMLDKWHRAVAAQQVICNTINLIGSVVAHIHVLAKGYSLVLYSRTV